METPSRVCPQCGNTTWARECPLDGWATVPEGLASERRLPLGTILLGRYRAGAFLKHDGAVAVYGGLDEQTGHAVHVAVVPLPLGTPLEVVGKMQRAAKSLETLRHPMLVPVLASGTTDRGDLLMVSEQVAGPTLADKLRAGPLGPDRTAELGVALLSALEAAHGAGVAHHDLTPDRIFMPAPEQVRVERVGMLDLQRLARPDESELALVRHGARYAAPEMARDKLVTRQADLYATGAILYEALTGRPVFDEPTAADQLVAHLGKLPAPPTVGGATLEGPLVELILHCLAKKPWNRPDNATVARTALDAAIGNHAAWTVRSVTPRAAPAVNVSLGVELPGGGGVTELVPVPPMPTTSAPVSAVPNAMMTRDAERPRVQGGTKPHLAQVKTLDRSPTRAWPWLVAAAVIMLVAWRVTRTGEKTPIAPLREGSALAATEALPHDRPTIAVETPVETKVAVPEPVPAAPQPEIAKAIFETALEAPKAAPVVEAPKPAEVAKVVETPKVETPKVVETPKPAEVVKPAAAVVKPKVDAAAEEAKRVAANERWKARQEAEKKAAADAEAARVAAREAARKARAEKTAAERLAAQTPATPATPAEKPATSKPTETSAPRRNDDAPPAAAMRRAGIVTNPPGATVMLDGAAIGRTPSVLSWAPGATANVTLVLEGYEPRHVQLDDTTNGHTLRLDLKPKATP